MDMTTIAVLGTAAAIAGLLLRTNRTIATQGAELRGQMDALRTELGGRIDALIHANQQAHDTIGLRIDKLGRELRGRIDAQGKELGERIDAQGKELGERIDAQGGRIDAQGKELGGRIDALEARVAKMGEDVSFIKGRLLADAAG